jgi:LysR family nitrogen assimilation transcriptional regulator
LDTRRLLSFVKIVDTGSLTRAADILHIAQPALSQQVSALEVQFKQRLLIRSKRGVVPTEAGKALYRHAQLILRQVEQAHADIGTSGNTMVGSVSVGLAPYSIGATLALGLLQAVRARYPSIVLHINENFGGVISEMVMTGRMDMALIYDPGPMRGTRFTPMLTEELYLVTSREGADGDVPLAELRGIDLFLPSRIHTVRKVVDITFRRFSVETNLIGEIESASTLAGAVASGAGSTILPLSAARAVAEVGKLGMRRLVRPSIEVKVSLCISDHLPMSEPAIAVYAILEELAKAYAAEQAAAARR